MEETINIGKVREYVYVSENRGERERERKKENW